MAIIALAARPSATAAKVSSKVSQGSVAISGQAVRQARSL